VSRGRWVQTVPVSKLTVIAGGAGRASDSGFDALVRTHYEPLFRVAYRLTHSPQDAEDLVQETLIRAYRNSARVAELDNPRTWLLCVMRNLFIDQTRRSDWQKLDPIDEGAQIRLSNDGPGPMELAESEQMARRIESSWRKLGREHRMLLALHDVEGYSLAELQEITGLKIGTLKSRLHRARVKLGRMLQSQDGFEQVDSGRRANS